MNRKERRAAAKQDTGAEASRLFAQAVALHQTGRLKECVPLYRKVLMLVPTVPEAHHNLGIALKGLGKLDDAIDCYRKALLHNPSYADAHNSLGNALSDLGKMDEALSCFQTAVKLAPSSAATHNNLGTALLDLGQIGAAEAAFRQALALDTHYAEAHNNLGAALAELNKPDDAITHYDHALACDPNHARANANRATMLLKLGRLDEALINGRQAVAIDPQSGHALNTLGNILKAMGHLTEAAEFYGHAVKAQPQAPELHDNLGNALSELGRSNDAEASCRLALTLDPTFAKAHNNLGTALKDQGRRAEAELCFRKALELAPDMAAAHTNLGMSLLYNGDYPAGWREFEWRWTIGKLAPSSFSQPRWVGNDIAGKTIVLTAEQGMGDVLQFCRFAEPIAALGARVILQVHKPLVRLLSTVTGASEVVAFEDTLPAFDTYLPLMSAPLVLGTTLNSIPNSVPYIHAPHSVERTEPGLKVGLVWAGDPRPHDAAANAADRRRSIPLSAFSPLLNLPNVTVFSLQKGEAASQIQGTPIKDVMTDVADFVDTAALVAGLDLIISVDTSVAHLAGAMGKPVWVLSRYDSCWRWMAERDDSPWYPTLKLFRQTSPGDWESVIANVVAAIQP